MKISKSQFEAFNVLKNAIFYFETSIFQPT